MAILNDYESANSSPSTRGANNGCHSNSTITRQRSKSGDHSRQNSVEKTDGLPSPVVNGFAKDPPTPDHTSSCSSTLDSKILRKYEFLGIDPASVSKTSVDAMSHSYHESLSAKNSDDREQSVNIMSTSLINFDTNGVDRSKYQFSSNFSSNEYSMSKSQTLSQCGDQNSSSRSDGIEKLSGLVSELNEIIKDASSASGSPKTENAMKSFKKGKFILPLEEVPRNDKESKFILPLEEIDSVLRRQRFSMKKCELKKLQSEQSRLLDAINKVKTKLLDIQQQKDEIIREVGSAARMASLVCSENL